MRRVITIAVAFAVAFLFAPRISSLGTGEAWAVKPPTQESRDEAEKHHEKEKKIKAQVTCGGGCPYGKDKVTKKCYQPKEGQFYVDCKTGDVKMMKTSCVNLPWKPCGGTPATSKDKATSKEKAKGKSAAKEEAKPAAKKSSSAATATPAAAKSSSRGSATAAGAAADIR